MNHLKHVLDLAQQNPIILDTETTALHNPDVVSFGAVNLDGSTIVDTLIKATNKITPGAAAIHGLTDEQLKDAPSIVDVWAEHIAPLTGNGRPILIYNSRFDLQALSNAFRLKRAVFINPQSTGCIMEAFAQFRGIRGRYGSYRWHKLGMAVDYFEIKHDKQLHNALADAYLAAAVLRQLMNQGVTK